MVIGARFVDFQGDNDKRKKFKQCLGAPPGEPLRVHRSSNTEILPQYDTDTELLRDFGSKFSSGLVREKEGSREKE